MFENKTYIICNHVLEADTKRYTGRQTTSLVQIRFILAHVGHIFCFMRIFVLAFGQIDSYVYNYCIRVDNIPLDLVSIPLVNALVRII